MRAIGYRSPGPLDSPESLVDIELPRPLSRPGDLLVEVGADVSRFSPCDEVFYAGVLNRPGTNAEFNAVDARIVGRKPATLDFAQAAAARGKIVLEGF